MHPSVCCAQCLQQTSSHLQNNQYNDQFTHWMNIYILFHVSGTGFYREISHSWVQTFFWGFLACPLSPQGCGVGGGVADLEGFLHLLSFTPLAFTGFTRQERALMLSPVYKKKKRPLFSLFLRFEEKQNPSEKGAFILLLKKPWRTLKS